MLKSRKSRQSKPETDERAVNHGGREPTFTLDDARGIAAEHAASMAADYARAFYPRSSTARAA